MTACLVPRCAAQTIAAKAATRIALVAVGSTLAWTIGCAGPRNSVNLWVVGPQPMYDATRTNELLGEPALESFISLAGATNETLTFRFAVRSSETAIDGPKLSIVPFHKSDPGDYAPTPTALPHLRLYRMRRVKVSSPPGWLVKSTPPKHRVIEPLDVLVPLRAPRGALPEQLSPGETYEFWADVAIPKGTAPGVHRGRIDLAANRLHLGSIDIELTVWPLVLPDEGDLTLLGDLDHRALFRHHVLDRGRPIEILVDDWRSSSHADELENLLASTLRTLQNHRLTPTLGGLSPSIRTQANGELAFNWEQYDSIARRCFSGDLYFNRVPQKWWAMPSRHIFDSLAESGAAITPSLQRLLRDYFSQVGRHFQENGWLERSFFLLPHDEGRTQTAQNVEDLLASIIRDADSRIKVVSRGWPQDMTPYGWPEFSSSTSAKNIDVWMPLAQFYDADAMDTQRAAGRKTWIALDRPPFSGCTCLHAHPTDVRVIGWQADQLAANVVHLGRINPWPKMNRSATPQECIAHDSTSLIFPGRFFGLDEPVASVRLKHIRTGMQDAAYRKLLRQNGLDHVVATLGRSLAPYAGSDAYRTHFADGRTHGWTRDETMFETARTIMANEVLLATSAAEPRAAESQLERTSAWRRLMTGTRSLELRADGARIRLLGTRTRWEADLECFLTLSNRTRSLIEGLLQTSDLPQGWTAPQLGTQISRIPPNQARRVSLSVHATSPPNARDGVMSIPIKMQVADGDDLQVPIRVAYVTAVPYSGTLTIDGNLSDWPAGDVNVASNFRLISGLSNDPSDTPASGPRRQTVCFLMRDEENLYIAVNCEFRRRTAGDLSRRNRVRYDDLIPTGQELVELLFDPLNSGTRSPDDLYHVVVKPSGAYITERGIQTSPPCAKRQIWPVDLEVATSIADDRWTAELRIPLDSLQDGNARHVIWGFNVTRYDQENQSFSTWSGAVGNAYDPLTLGNLYLP